MEYLEARQLLINETIGEGIVYSTRMGALPTAEQMEPILQALEVVASEVSGQATIDRELAGSLFLLGFDVQGQIDKMLETRDVRDELLAVGIVDMWDQIREIFFDDER